jgi:hypothetical protein
MIMQGGSKNLIAMAIVAACLVLLGALPAARGFLLPGAGAGGGRAAVASRQRLSMSLSPIPDLSGREFQLEELEDKDRSASSVVLEGDGSVAVGKTDGPLFSAASGTWKVKDDTFFLVITRQFDTYDVTREYVGTLEEDMKSTGTIILSGDIQDEDRHVGFWKLIRFV